MKIFPAWFASDIPNILECGNHIGRVKRFSPSSFFKTIASPLYALKRSGNGLAMHSRHKADVPNNFPPCPFIFFLLSPKPLAQMFPIDVVFGDHIHMNTMVTDLLST